MKKQNRKRQLLLLLPALVGTLLGPPADAREMPEKPLSHHAETDTPQPSLPMTLSEGQRVFGTISDIHFDPFYDPTLVDKLARTAPSEWNAIFETSSLVTPSTAGNDTNYPLLKTSLASLSTYAPLFDYLLVPGDLLAHHFREKYDASASDKSTAAYERFVLKTTQYVMGELKSRLPHRPVIVALGNNDSFCGDYMIEPAAGYLYDTAPDILALSGSPEALENYPQLGAYVIPHPQTPNHYFVVFDNLFFSRKYSNACGIGAVDPSQALLLWLKSTLYRLQRMDATATLVMHVPSGIDAYSSADSCNSDATPTPYLNSKTDRIFKNLIEHYREQITALFSGHSHMDDYRVFTDAQGGAYAYQRIIPSISPIFGNNPSYQIYSYERTSAAPVNYLNMTYSDLTDSGASTWTLEYNFKMDYGVSTLSAENLLKLAEEITAYPETREQFIDYYSGGADSGTITQENWPAFACALTQTDAESFSNCFCAEKE